mgnify:CR=1 FL=1
MDADAGRLQSTEGRPACGGSILGRAEAPEHEAKRLTERCLFVVPSNINTIEGLWTTLRNFLRPFRGVHKKHLAGYVAICEFAINLKRITPAFIAALVREHDF